MSRVRPSTCRTLSDVKDWKRLPNQVRLNASGVHVGQVGDNILSLVRSNNQTTSPPYRPVHVCIREPTTGVIRRLYSDTTSEEHTESLANLPPTFPLARYHTHHPRNTRTVLTKGVILSCKGTITRNATSRAPP